MPLPPNGTGRFAFAAAASHQFESSNCKVCKVVAFGGGFESPDIENWSDLDALEKIKTLAATSVIELGKCSPLSHKITYAI